MINYSTDWMGEGREERGVTIEIDTLEEQQTEEIETELRDVDRIRIRKVYACCPGWPSGGS
jgi:hypothetical protein